MRAYIWVVAAVALVISAAAGQASAHEAPAVTTGIDADPAGNEANSLGTIEACRTVSQGDSFQVDVFVKGIPPASGFNNGLSGFGFNFKYDPAILRVMAIDPAMMLAAAGPRNPFEVVDDLPDSDGNFRVDEADLSQRFESGDGVLLRLTLEAIGPGLSNLILEDDSSPDNLPDILGAAGNPQYDIAAIHHAAIGVDRSCTAPTPEVPDTPAPSTPGGGSPDGTGEPGGGSPSPTPPPGESPDGSPGPTAVEEDDGNPGPGEDDDDGGISTGTVIAIVVGIAGAATAIGAGAWLARRRSRPL